MKDHVFLSEEKPYYKANLHCHTTVSDGSFTPEEMKAAYQKAGYSIVAFTDHNRYVWQKQLGDESFLPLAAYEVDINDFPKSPDGWPTLSTYHINLYDTDPTQNQAEKALSKLPPRRYGDFAAINGYLQEMAELGFLACYNHPYWSLQNYEDYKGLRGLFAMEIYNHGCELDGLYGFHPQAYDEMLRTGQRLFCLAADDNHNRFPLGSAGSDSFGGFVQLQAEELSYPSVISALRKGSFYWSMGPEIRSLSLKDGKLFVKTSPVEKIYVLQQGRDCYQSLAEPGQTITEAEFSLTGKEGWFRLQCRDSRGLSCGTNAYFIDSL